MRTQDDIANRARGILMGALLGDALGCFDAKDLLKVAQNGIDVLFCDRDTLPFTSLSVHLVLALETALNGNARMEGTDEYVDFSAEMRDALGKIDETSFSGMHSAPNWVPLGFARGLVAAPLAMTAMRWWCEPEPMRNSTALAINLSGFTKEDQWKQNLMGFASSLLMAIMGNCDTFENVRMGAARLAQRTLLRQSPTNGLADKYFQGFIEKKTPIASITLEGNAFIGGALTFCHQLEKVDAWSATDAIVRQAGGANLREHGNAMLTATWQGALCGAWLGADKFDEALMHKHPCYARLKTIMQSMVK